MIRSRKYSIRIVAAILIILGSIPVFSQEQTFYDLSARNIDGDTINFSVFRGKKVLVVNTASECMLTPQYKKLQELYEEYGGDDFEIVAFPCNDFGNQEPGTNEDIKDFCAQYNIVLPLWKKSRLKTTRSTRFTAG